MPASSYNLTARATDNAGGIATWAVVAITGTRRRTCRRRPASPHRPTAPPSRPRRRSPSPRGRRHHGTVSLVEFFQGTTKIGQATAAPYTVSWTNVAAGAYNLTARATDNSGGITTSAASALR